MNSLALVHLLSKGKRMKSKRKEFYLTTKALECSLSSAARSVFMYLSYCFDRKGECFPSMRRIAEVCGVCRNTALKAVNELEAAGLISRSPRVVKCGCGIRQTSNAYRLLAARGVRKPEPVKEEKPDEDDGLKALLAGLNISGLYEDKDAAKAVEMAIRELWYSENFRFKGESVSRARVRERLRELDIYAIDTVMFLLSEAGGAANKTAYLKALVYNAPFQTCAVTASEIARFRKYGAYD